MVENLKKKETVLIVGCGNIAGGLEMSLNKDLNFPITHAGAYKNDSRFLLSGFVDPEIKKRNEFMKYWNVTRGFNNLSEVLELGECFDIISICSPTNKHFHHLEEAIKLRPKIVFAEKPLTTEINESKKIIEKYKKENIKLAVNYSRRWDTSLEDFMCDMSNGKFGKLRSVNALYNKGIMNNGSHLIDLFNIFFADLKVFSVGSPSYDFFEDDPSIPFVLIRSNNLFLNVNCGHASDYDLFEIQFVFSLGIITMELGGLSWRERSIKKDMVFSGYKILTKGKTYLGKNLETFSNAINNIYDSVNKKADLKSTGETALLAQKLCEKIKRKSLSNFKRKNNE